MIRWRVVPPCADDADLFADQGIEERRFADVGAPTWRHVDEARSFPGSPARSAAICSGGTATCPLALGFQPQRTNLTQTARKFCACASAQCPSGGIAAAKTARLQVFLQPCLQIHDLLAGNDRRRSAFAEAGHKRLRGGRNRRRLHGADDRLDRIGGIDDRRWPPLFSSPSPRRRQSPGPAHRRSGRGFLANGLAPAAATIAPRQSAGKRR